MDYTSIDPAARARALSLSTGEGDLKILSAGDALVSEQSAVVLELKVALLKAHGSSTDPDAPHFKTAGDALTPKAIEVRQVANKIAKATKTDVSKIGVEIWAMNLAKAEADHFDADWKLNNLPEETAEETAVLELARGRAEREIAVLKVI